MHNERKNTYYAIITAGMLYLLASYLANHQPIDWAIELTIFGYQIKL